jgi:transcriptional regulator with XRE-family HTH domain
VQQRERQSERQRDELGRFVREQRRLAELSLRKLADLSGVSNPYLSQIERGLRLPSAEVLRQLAPALGVPAETLYARAGLLGPAAVTVDLVALIRHDPQLDEDQKRTLVHIYESFRAGGDDPARAGTVPATVGVAGESSGKDIG